MNYTGRQQLTIVESGDGEERFSIDDLKHILIEYPSNIIYCETKGKLAGIISMGDIMRACEQKQDDVFINRKFSSLYFGEYSKAKTIFHECETINALPVITKDNILTGEYTRWDDLLILDYLMEGDCRLCMEKWKKEQSILLVQPNKVFADRQYIYTKLITGFRSQKIAFKCIGHSEVSKYLYTDNNILFVDENEKRACNTRLNIMLGKGYSGCEKLKTYRDLFDKDANWEDAECALYLKKLQHKGIKILGLTFEMSVYYRQLLKKIEERFVAAGKLPCNELPESMYEEFFVDLYSKEYAEAIMNMPIECENNGGVYYLKDCRGQYENVIAGERYTANQPKQYTKSIYFYGPCYIYGHYVEDKNTIESIVQKKILDVNKGVRVVNCGSLSASGKYGYLSRIAATELKKGDMIVVDQPPKGIDGVFYLDLNQILEDNHVKAEWLVDNSFHCNHKVNYLYAQAISDMIEFMYHENKEKSGEIIEKKDSIIKTCYLNRYFADFDSSLYNKIGAVVMNCNPFTQGHRYLVEQALKEVDFLIIFVVEEDKSYFTFAERFAMVKKGVIDLDNVRVVPSGPFILSRMSFPEYFKKEISEYIQEHTENDIIVFAEKIASQLGIRYRFFGEEPLDEVTNHYNSAMKKILPKYGIKAVEIPRKAIHNTLISGTVVRKCIENEDIDQLNEFLPETTRRILGLFKETVIDDTNN